MTGWRKKCLFGVAALGLTHCGGPPPGAERAGEQAEPPALETGTPEEAAGALSNSSCPRAWRVEDIFPGLGSSRIAELTDVDGTLFFVADDGEHGVELWKSDGTARGTKLVEDIVPGPEGSFPRELTAVGGTLFFAVGTELWKSDGTACGTERVAAFAESPFGPTPRNLAAFRGKLVFNGFTEALGAEPWVSDGSRRGTHLLADVEPGARSSNPGMFTEFKGQLFFTGFRTIEDIEPRFLFKADSRGHVTDVDSISDEASFDELLAVDGKLFTLINDEAEWRLDVTDGSHPLRNLAFFGNDRARHLTALRGKVFFDVGMELWRSNGTEAGTRLVKAIGPRGADPGLEFLTVLRDRLYFSADDGVSGRELWVSDGSERGTRLFADLNPGPASSSPTDLLAVHNSKMYFAADDGVHGREPWKLHADAKAPELLKDIAPGAASSSPRNFTRSDDLVFFAADDGRSGEELWAAPKEPGACCR